MTPTPTTKKESQPTLARHEFGSEQRSNVPVPAHLQVSASPHLMAQAVHTMNKRVRVRRAHTKDRPGVRGGGIKPWKQKGTGRARHASIRSPIWVGGGTVFGPRSRHERVLPMPEAMRRRALATAFNEHVVANTLSIVAFTESLPLKTADFVKQLPEEGRNLLIIIAEEHTGLLRVARNAVAARVILVERVSVEDILKARQIWVDEAALPLLERRLSLRANKLKANS